MKTPTNLNSKPSGNNNNNNNHNNNNNNQAVVNQPYYPSPPPSSSSSSSQKTSISISISSEKPPTPIPQQIQTNQEQQPQQPQLQIQTQTQCAPTPSDDSLSSRIFQVLYAEANDSVRRAISWFNKNIGVDQVYFKEARDTPPHQRHLLDTAIRFVTEVVAALSLVTICIPQTPTTPLFSTKEPSYTAIWKLIAKLSHMIEIHRGLVKLDDVYLAEITKELSSVMKIVDFSLKNKVGESATGVPNRPHFRRVGVSALHVWGDALQSFAETSLRQHIESYILCLQFAADRYSKLLAIQPKRHEAKYGLGNVLLLQAKALSPIHPEYNHILKQAQESYKSATKDFSLTNDYVYRLARASALLGDEELCMKSLRQYVFDAGGRKSPSPIQNTMLSHPDFSRYRTADWFGSLVEYTKALEIQDRKSAGFEEKAHNNMSDSYHILTSSLMQDGFAIRVLSEMLSWFDTPLVKTNNDSQNKDVELIHEEENEYVTTQKLRLQRRLELYGLVPRRDIPGDGNCQMHAISDQIYGDLSKHAEVRRLAVEWLRKNKDYKLPNGAIIHQFVHDRTWENYCVGMEKDGSWGDHLTLMAISELYNATILIISSVEGDNFITEIRPTGITDVSGTGEIIPSPKSILLSHYAEFHYGSLTYA